MITDTHSHLSFKAYDADREEVVKRTKEAGVVCIDVGTKYETSKLAIELAEKNEGIYAAIGMHPIHIKTDLMKLKMDEEEGAFEPLGEEFDRQKYKELLKSPKVVAIGEIGLDYYYKPKGATKQEKFKQKQREVFIEQIDLAVKRDLPIIIHCRMAHEDVLDILGRFKGLASVNELRGVIHCFTGSWEQAQKYMDLGFYLGINGIIFKFDIDEVIKKAPLDRLLTETDCPYLAPPEAGEKRNEPIFVKHVIQKIADLRGMSFDEVADATTQNAKKLFNI
ncbi:MAG: TatD family hydrolase [Candidatus Staskawiczbacteria bacterium]|nr:TatD family hydrolase [Candidatus Staskawiczbacteria bacterium]